MTLSVYNDDGSINRHEIKKELFYDKKIQNRVSYINSSKKEENALNFFRSYFSDAKSILFDNSNKLIQEELKRLNIPSFNSNENTENIFNDKDFSFLYFTSGSTGFPVGALKTKEDLLLEIEETTKLLKKFNIKKVIVTVPFVHVYGTLFGLIYPLMNNIDIILKEHFLPNDLLDFVTDNCLVVTTPLYIKSLNRLQTSKDLSKSLFVSSTAPLFPNVVKEFKEKFKTNIIHIFGSTETGGTAYKYNDDDFWTPMEKVIISTNDKKELHIKSPYVSKFLYEKEFKNINKEIQTFDYVEIKNNKFKLLGRSSQILKISGKRYSTIQIESILEEIPEINKALVFVQNSDNSLRGETLDITLESKKEFKIKEIRDILQTKLSNIKFSIDLKYVDKIKVSSLGKKLLTQ